MAVHNLRSKRKRSSCGIERRINGMGRGNDRTANIHSDVHIVRGSSPNSGPETRATLNGVLRWQRKQTRCRGFPLHYYSVRCLCAKNTAKRAQAKRVNYS